MPVRIEQIWRYPVKSMIGGLVTSADLHPLGIVGDRAWAVRDHVRGGIRGAKQLGGLMRLAARYADGSDGPVVITLPDGAEVSTAEPDASERVSAALDHPVTLEALRPPGDLDHYRRGRPDHDDIMDELRSVFGRTEDEPLPDFSVFPEAVFEYESPPGTYYDAFPLMLLTTSALRSLRDALPGSRVDVRRFRPSIVVDTGGEPGHPEVGWMGRRLAIGDAEVEVTTGCPRCVMVTREIDGETPQDRSILRHIVKDLGQNVGVYATVTIPGRIRTGDAVTLAA
ncbi:MAG TPA: MOSC N-terminal beta barrel domain-containing protein [Acidimicrobiales bacterium]